jgi:hypothetical protein
MEAVDAISGEDAAATGVRPRRSIDLPVPVPEMND